MAWISWSRTWATRSTTTTSRKPLSRSWKNSRWKRMYLLLRGRSKAKAKPLRPTSACSSTRTVPIGERKWTDVEPEDYSPVDYQCQNNWLLFFVMVNYLEKKMVRLNSGDQKMIIGTISSTLSIGLMKCWRVKWKEAEATRKDSDPSGQEILYRRALQGHSGRNPIDPSLQDNVLIRTISSSTCIILDVQSLQPPSQIQDWQRKGQKFEQKTDGILHVCGSYEQGTQRSAGAWLDRTTSCMVQAEKVEETSKHGVLGRHQTCSKEKVCNHPSRHTSSLSYPESYYDGNWRNHIREVCASPKGLWTNPTKIKNINQIK